MSLKAGFTVAWLSFKNFVVKADAFVTKNGPTIQKDVVIGEHVLVAAVPSLAPVVSVFDGFEEALAGEVFSLVHTGAAVLNAQTGEATITLSAELSAIVKHLADTLAGHPAVVAAKA